MEKREFRSNYILTLLNLVLFLVLFCFLFEATRIFLQNLNTTPHIKLWVLFLGGTFPFLFYTFIVDTGNFYEKMQHFFFRHSVFALIIPSPLIILALGYFLIPKLLSITFNRDIFIFLGGVAFMVHLIFTAHTSRGTSFIGFVNYLFMFSLLYLSTLIFFACYLAVGFELHLGQIGSESIKSGFFLVKNIFLQLVP